jgi:hypothetical protein
MVKSGVGDRKSEMGRRHGAGGDIREDQGIQDILAL